MPITTLAQRVLSHLPRLGLIYEDMTPIPDLLEQVRLASPTELCEGAISDPVMTELVRAGLLLVSGGLDEAHRIVQPIEVPEAYYWHAIVHRLEPDWANAKYWFRRLGRHAVFEELATPAIRAALPGTAVLEHVLTDGRLDPFRVVDLCEACVNGTAPILRHELEALQREEIARLLHTCLRSAKV
ncbi:MAG: hypothetical protein D6690_14985 [Nitrospirae bacterium]|nr:MAG: hypothetical protein D6690_14985 [Nitrospirota bacterium]